MRWTRGTGVAVVAFAIAGGVCAVSFGGGCASVLGVESDRYLVAPDTGASDTGTPGPQGDAASDAGAGDGSAYPPGWECLGPPPPAVPSGNVQVKFLLSDVTNATSGSQGTPIAGADVHACAKLDTGCATPFADTTSDDAGAALVTLPGGFSGYFEIHAANFTPAIVSRPPQYVSQTQQQGMADLSLLSAGAPLAGVTQDPNLSIAIVSALDCTTNPAEGIVFYVGSPGPGEQVVYLSNNLPSKSATQTDTASGSALIFNVPAGTLSVTAAFATTGTSIRTVTSLARKNWVTLMVIEADQATRPPL